MPSTTAAATSPPKRHTQHRDADGRAVLRGADGRGGLLLGLLAALPPRHPVGDRRRRGLGAARPDHRPEPPAASRGTCELHELFPGEDWQGARRRHRPAAGARQRRRADLLRRGRRGQSRSTATRSATSACTSSPAAATVETVFGALAGRARATTCCCRGPPTHRWVPDGRRAAAAATRSRPTSHIGPPKRYLSRFGQLLEHAPYCERDLHGPAEPLLVDGHRTSRCYVKHRGTARRHRRHALRTPDTTRSTWSAGTAASTRTRSTSPTSSRSPAGCTSRRRCTRCSRATTSSSATSCRARSTTTRWPIPVPYYHSNVDSDEVMFYCGGDYEARKGSGIGQGSISAAPRRPHPRPAARRGRAGASARSSSTSWPSWSTRSARWSSARAAGRARTRATRGPGRGAARHPEPVTHWRVRGARDGRGGAGGARRVHDRGQTRARAATAPPAPTTAAPDPRGVLPRPGGVLQAVRRTAGHRPGGGRALPRREGRPRSRRRHHRDRGRPAARTSSSTPAAGSCCPPRASRPTSCRRPYGFTCSEKVFVGASAD